jgi:hypothetical protein
MFDVTYDDNHLANKLKIFSSGLGNVFNELMESVGDKMVSEAKSNAPVRTGKLKNAINFQRTNDSAWALTTRKNKLKKNIYYARFVEGGADIKPRKTKYLTFKINGAWRRVEHVRLRKQPFMENVYNEYFGSESSKGYKELANALEKRMNEAFV